MSAPITCSNVDWNMVNKRYGGEEATQHMLAGQSALLELHVTLTCSMCDDVKSRWGIVWPCSCHPLAT